MFVRCRVKLNRIHTFSSSQWSLEPIHFTPIMSLTTAFTDLFNALKKDSSWMPELYIPSSHFHKKGCVLHLTSTDKLALESEVTTMEDINVIELLSSTTILTQSTSHLMS